MSSPTIDVNQKDGLEYLKIISDKSDFIIDGISTKSKYIISTKNKDGISSKNNSGKTRICLNDIPRDLADKLRHLDLGNDGYIDGKIFLLIIN